MGTLYVINSAGPGGPPEPPIGKFEEAPAPADHLHKQLALHLAGRMKQNPPATRLRVHDVDDDDGSA